MTVEFTDAIPVIDHYLPVASELVKIVGSMIESVGQRHQVQSLFSSVNDVLRRSQKKLTRGQREWLERLDPEQSLGVDRIYELQLTLSSKFAENNSIAKALQEWLALLTMTEAALKSHAKAIREEDRSKQDHLSSKDTLLIGLLAGRSLSALGKWHNDWHLIVRTFGRLTGDTAGHEVMDVRGLVVRIGIEQGLFETLAIAVEKILSIVEGDIGSDNAEHSLREFTRYANPDWDEARISDHVSNYMRTRHASRLEEVAVELLQRHQKTDDHELRNLLNVALRSIHAHFQEGGTIGFSPAVGNDSALAQIGVINEKYELAIAEGPTEEDVAHKALAGETQTESS